jgi:hypothetical protein
MFLVSASRDRTAELTPYVQGLVSAEADGPDANSIYVLRQPSRTTASWGIHHDEVQRLSGACHYMLTHRRRLWFITIGDGIQQLPAGEARAIVDAFLKALVTMQRKEGLPQDYALVWHCSKGLHAHVICPANRRILDALKESARFGQYLHQQWAFDVHVLAKYLSREMTPQAYRRYGGSIRRKRGSHQLPGGGDRVRLSSALKADAIAAGYITPWKPTNAKRKPPEARKPPKDYRPRRIKSSAAPTRTPTQSLLFPELEKPPVRLRDFHGGIPTPTQREEIEFRRQRLGLSQRQVAALAGISQPHYANVVRGHDRMSRFTARQLRKALLDADALEAA